MAQHPMPSGSAPVRLALALCGLLYLAGSALLLARPAPSTTTPPPSYADPTPDHATSTSPDPAQSRDTTLWAHNLRLRKGSSFRIYVPWIRGLVLPTGHAAPSLDDPTSFVLDIQKGVVRANLGDIGNFLNTADPDALPLRNIALTGDGSTVKLTGTLRKLLLPLPIELTGTLSPTATGGVHLHVDKIDVLHIPFKAALHLVHVELDDITGRHPVTGLTATGNDLFFDTTTMLPPPHIRGTLTALSIRRPDLILIYGDASNDEQREAQWHNFLRFSGGALGFGRLTMSPAELTMIDASDEPWFDLDLVNYRAQLTSGVTRMTADNTLEIFMPSLDEHSTRPVAPAITVDWLRDRKQDLPAGILRR